MIVNLADLLLPEERRLLFDDECYPSKSLLRGWWRGYRRTNIMRLLEALRVGAPRMLAQRDFLSRIEESQELGEWSQLRVILMSYLQAAGEMNDTLASFPSRRGSPQRSHVESLKLERAQRRRLPRRTDYEGWISAAEKAIACTSQGVEHPMAAVRLLAQEAWILEHCGIPVREL
jgi:hypothetical protein